MTQYIDKAAVIAEIERRINGINLDLDTIEDWRYRVQWEHDIEIMKNILSFINTLEVKEVNLEKEIDNYLNPIEAWQIQEEPFSSMEKIAKYFFELGLKTQKGK